MKPRSLRVRLMLWYLAILAVILCLFATVIYVTLQRTLLEQLDDGLSNRAFFVSELVTFSAAGEPQLSLGGEGANPDADDTFQRLLDPAGAVIFDTNQAFGKVPVDPEALDAAREGRHHGATVDTGNGEARVLTLPLRRDGAVAGVLQVGESTGDMQETLRTLLLIFAVALPSSLVLASLGGWWLSSRALAPIDPITQAAREISGGSDLNRRLALDLPDDEVGRLARTFDEMLARLDAAFQRQRQFTADASHELRTPLTAIRGQIDVALERPRDTAEYRRVLGAVNEQVDRMTRLVGGLLMLARSDAGALPVEREPVDLRDLVESVAEQVRPLAAQKSLDLRIEPGGPLAVSGDEDLLLQLMLNLADNAARYTSRGSITLGWRKGDRAEMFVRDTGAGIPPEQRERIFERFYRIEASRSREGGGAGLGLAICRWIAEAHGGALSVESDHAGATFTVGLPLDGSSDT
ncbi:MAG: ATP-binding protein [Dehalococcoidia bacterium]